jgi:hypothetical protein
MQPISIMQRATPCTLCKENHRAALCPELTEALKDGFYSGGGGHRDHGDGEEEHVRFIVDRDTTKNLNPPHPLGMINK